MTEQASQCVGCGQALSARTQERGFKRCYDCYLKAKPNSGGGGGQE